MNFNNITSKMVGHSVILISPLTDKFASVNGGGEFLVAGPPVGITPVGIAFTYAIHVEPSEHNALCCKIYDVDAGVRSYLYRNQESDLIHAVEEGGVEPEVFSFFGIDDSHCFIYSCTNRRVLSVDMEHNIDPDGEAHEIYADKDDVNENCIFEFHVV